MTPQKFLDEFGTLAEAKGGVQKLRELILDLAVRGKLVEQDDVDQPASALLEAIKQSSDNGTNRGPRRKPAPTLPHDPPFVLPSSWAWTRVGDVLSLKHGYAFKSSTFTNEPTPFVLTSPGSFHETGGFRDRGPRTRYVQGAVDPEFIFNPGDLMIPMTEQAPGLLGSPAFIPNDGRTYVHNQRLGKLEPFSSTLSPEFVFLFFNSPFLRGELAKSCSGTTVRHTSPKKILNVLFPFCALSEQKRIVSKVTDLLSQVTRLESTLTRREATRTQLLTAAIDSILSGATDDDNNVVLASVTEVEITFVGNHHNDI